MYDFKFAIMGAGKIARKFCKAVEEISNCRVAAVASKSIDRAESFAKENEIPSVYCDYEKMLLNEDVDGVYIATTVNFHYELCMLCLKYKKAVICEKAMFQNSAEAEEVFRIAEQNQVFIMEAMWSRFLPAVCKAKEWVENGKIGKVTFGDIGLGFLAKQDIKNRYWNMNLGGGVALDLTVYAYELITYMIKQPIINKQVSVIRYETGVDAAELISIRFSDAIAALKTSFLAPMEECMILYGTEGKIIVPKPHTAKDAYLYNRENKEIEHFQDTGTLHGFVYEINEMIKCVRNGKTESETVPHELTLECARLFDEIGKIK